MKGTKTGRVNGEAEGGEFRTKQRKLGDTLPGGKGERGAPQGEGKGEEWGRHGGGASWDNHGERVGRGKTLPLKIQTCSLGPKDQGTSVSSFPVFRNRVRPGEKE